MSEWNVLWTFSMKYLRLMNPKLIDIINKLQVKVISKINQLLNDVSERGSWRKQFCKILEFLFLLIKAAKRYLKYNLQTLLSGTSTWPPYGGRKKPLLVNYTGLYETVELRHTYNNQITCQFNVKLW